MAATPAPASGGGLCLTLRKRLRNTFQMDSRRNKNPAAVVLGSLGGRAGIGAVKRRGNADYYRELVARRRDRRLRGAAMEHRHLNHRDFTLAAIDDIIGRGRLPAWAALRDELFRHPEVLAKVERICAAHASDPYAQRYHFWKHYVQAH